MMKITVYLGTATAAAALGLAAATPTFAAAFGPDNPFYTPSTLPYHAPPFDRIKDGDYQPAIEAGMAQHLREIDAIASNPAAPTFSNTIVALEKSGTLYERAHRAFFVADANSTPALQAAKTALAPQEAAYSDAYHLNGKLFRRIATVYRQRKSLQPDPEALRLVEVVYQEYVHAGARLSDADKARLKQINGQISTLTDQFDQHLQAAQKAGAFQTTDRSQLAGLSAADLAAAAQTARTRGVDGWVIPLLNTTTQPDLQSLSSRATRETIMRNALGRAERGDANDTRAIVIRLAQLRAEHAQLLGYGSHAAWKLEDQMARTPANVLKFLEQLAPLATARARAEAADIQAVIDAQTQTKGKGRGGNGGFKLSSWDWDRYAQQVRKARYDLDEDQVRQYFELDRVLRDGVLYAATQLYGITFKERHDIPVYQKDVRVFEAFDTDGKPMALVYFDYFARDNKNGGAWMDAFVHTSKLTGDLPVVFNVANLPQPAAGQPALISADDVTTMFHEFGHALHEIFGDTRFPTLSGTTPERDFVEFPSQFNEYWAWNPQVLAHYARQHATGAAMPEPLVQKVLKARTFNKGYDMTELVAAAMLDMQWHIRPAGAPVADVDAFEKDALAKTHLDVRYVPPRYRSTYFRHIWTGGSNDDDYSAGYYAYLWTQMLADHAWEWFDTHGGLTRANGDRFRRMILSRGNTVDLEQLYEAWRGTPPDVEAMKKYRGLGDTQ